MTAPAPMGTGAEPEPEGPAAAKLDPERAQSPLVERDLAEIDAPEFHREPEHGMNPVPVIVAAIVVLALAVGVFAYLTHGFKKRTKVAYQVPAVFNLRPGDCFNHYHNGIGTSPMPCPSPHEAEVFATFPATGSHWPGTPALRRQAQTGCQARIGGYMNPALAVNALDQEYFYPDKVAWAAGVRTIICDVTSISGSITGSVHSS